MSEAELELCRKALYEIERKEILKYDSLPQEWGDHSDEFNEKIKSLIAKTRRKESSYILMNSKKIIIAALTAILIASILVACRYAPLIKQFVIKIFEGHTDFYLEDDETYRDKIDNVFNPRFVPDGFKLIDSFLSDVMVKNVWDNGEDSIILAQSIKSTGVTGIDTTENQYDSVQIKDENIYYSVSRGYYVMVWLKDNYSFTLTCPTSISWADIEKMIVSLEPEEI